MHLEVPCKKDCPERHAGCHAECKRFQEYEAARNAMYESRIPASQCPEAYYVELGMKFRDEHAKRKLRGRNQWK